MQAVRRLDQVELKVDAGQCEDATSQPARLDDLDGSALVLAVVVQAQDRLETCAVKKHDFLKVEDDQSGAVEVNAVERGHDLTDVCEVEVSGHP
jgi:hypothetical protein